MAPSPITTIVHFSMPQEHVDEFVATWHNIQTIMTEQPGAIDGIMHRCIDEDSPFQLINVARWESPETLANALKATAEEQKKQGVDLTELMKRLNIKMSQNNYVVEMKYEV